MSGSIGGIIVMVECTLKRVASWTVKGYAGNARTDHSCTHQIDKLMIRQPLSLLYSCLLSR